MKGLSCRAPSGTRTTWRSRVAGRRRERFTIGSSGSRNDVGLLSEEYDTEAKRLVGNFPQAFTHIGLINTALNLARPFDSPTEQRASS